MTTSLWCLFIVAMIPYLLAFTGGYCRYKEFGTVDNKYPRTQAAQMTGAGARVKAAQENAWESVILFAAALLAVTIAGVPAEKTATVSLVYLGARIAHPIFYIANLDALRSLSFLVAWLSAICLFAMAL